MSFFGLPFDSALQGLNSSDPKKYHPPVNLTVGVKEDYRCRHRKGGHKLQSDPSPLFRLPCTLRDTESAPGGQLFDHQSLTLVLLFLWDLSGPTLPQV